MEENKEKVLSVKDLVISFKTDRGIVHAVRGVSFDLYKGETLCIVGESGSGKSVTNKAIMGISAKNAIIEHGQILYEGEDLVRVSEEEFHRIRGHKIGMIFQDPLSALNPVMRIGKQITEATLTNRNILKRKYADLISKELTAYRNNEANTSYNITRLENEIENNKKTISTLNDLTKDIKSSEEKISKLEAGDLTNEKIAEKLKYAKNNYEELLSKKEDLLNDYNDYVNRSKSDNLADIEKFESRVKKYSENIEFDNEFDLKIYQNKLDIAKHHLEVVKQKDYASFKGESIDEVLNNRNNFLKQLIESYKYEYKVAKPSLKEALKVSKKKAKIEVNAYAKKIKEEHANNLHKLNEELKNVHQEIEDYGLTLPSSQLQEIKNVIAFNETLRKKEEKETKKFKEINVSKTEKKTETYKEIPDEKYASLINKVEEIKKAIIKEEDDYINKTKITKAEAKKMALQVMKEVGIPMPEKRFKQYPFEFSGGMRQRIVIAIALTANPDILICDEPTTALDVTIQAQILELINRLKKERNLSCIFITHDLGVVANMADRVAVMYAGKIIEYGLANEVFFDPRHPYTWALLSSIPDVDSKEKLEAIPGTPPDMIYPPKGDAFALRSKYAMAIDFKYEPPYFKISDTHYAATWLLYPGVPKVEMPKIVKTRIENALRNNKEVNEDVE